MILLESVHALMCLCSVSPSLSTIIVTDFHQQNGVVKGFAPIEIRCETVFYKSRKGNTMAIEVQFLVFKMPWKEPRITISII